MWSPARFSASPAIQAAREAWPQSWQYSISMLSLFIAENGPFTEQPCPDDMTHHSRGSMSYANSQELVSESPLPEGRVRAVSVGKAMLRRSSCFGRQILSIVASSSNVPGLMRRPPSPLPGYLADVDTRQVAMVYVRLSANAIRHSDRGGWHCDETNAASRSRRGWKARP